MESIKSISISFLDVEAKDIPTFFNELKSVNNKVNLNYINSKANLKKDLYSKFKFMIHFDIMDNKFVPNTGVNIEYIKTAKNLGLYIDTHLMVENPIGERYIEKAITYGTDEITIHYEINNFESVLNYLNEKKEELKKVNRDLVIGVALKKVQQIKD